MTLVWILFDKPKIYDLPKTFEDIIEAKLQRKIDKNEKPPENVMSILQSSKAMARRPDHYSMLCGCSMKTLIYISLALSVVIFVSSTIFSGLFIRSDFIFKKIQEISGNIFTRTDRKKETVTKPGMISRVIQLDPNAVPINEREYSEIYDSLSDDTQVKNTSKPRSKQAQTSEQL